jgi:mRNA interferase MazF
MVKQWEIYFVNLDPIVGGEQAGLRPVLIISNNTVNSKLQIATIMPLTTYKPHVKLFPSEILLPASITGLHKDSVAMVYQIRTVSAMRLSRSRAGDVADMACRHAISNALLDHFGIRARQLD